MVYRKNRKPYERGYFSIYKITSDFLIGNSGLYRLYEYRTLKNKEHDFLTFVDY